MEIWTRRLRILDICRHPPPHPGIREAALSESLCQILLASYRDRLGGDPRTRGSWRNEMCAAKVLGSAFLAAALLFSCTAAQSEWG